MAGKTVIHR